MKKMIVVLALAALSTVYGVLPPLAQTSRELQAILADARFLELLGSAGIFHSIVKVEGGYLILTQTQALRVDIDYLRSNKVGPAAFELRFYPPLSVEESSPAGDEEG
jgi:hypothetical protein